MSVEPLSAYVRRMNGHPEMRWDDISVQIAELERRAERAEDLAAQRMDEYRALDRSLTTALEKIEWLAPRCNAAEAAARDFAKVLREHRDVSMPYDYGREYFPFAEALARHPEYSEESGT